MDLAVAAKTPGGLKLQKGTRIASDDYDRYTTNGIRTMIPKASFIEESRSLNSKESAARLEDGAVLDLSRATPEMTKAAYDISVEQFPLASTSEKEEEKRKEYVWLVLQKLIENPDLLKADKPEPKPEPSEEPMLPRSKPESRMKQPPRASAKPKHLFKLKKQLQPQPAKKSLPVVKPVDLAKLLQIPDLDYKSRKPKMEVMFDFGALGKQRARYHWVGISDKTLNLIFDTRFTMMDAYVPATIEDSDHVTEVSVSTADSDKRYDYRCWGSVITMEFGIFKIIQMVLVKDELGAKLHEENEDGQIRGDRSGVDAGGEEWAGPDVTAPRQESLREGPGEPRD